MFQINDSVLSPFLTSCPASQLPFWLKTDHHTVIDIAFNWDDMHKKVLIDLTRVFLMIIAGLLVALLLLQYILYRKAILPVRTIQGTVREYTENKDSCNALFLRPCCEMYTTERPYGAICLCKHPKHNFFQFFLKSCKNVQGSCKDEGVII